MARQQRQLPQGKYILRSQYIDYSKNMINGLRIMEIVRDEGFFYYN